MFTTVGIFSYLAKTVITESASSFLVAAFFSAFEIAC